MRTQLGSYCQQFDRTIRPVLDDLTAAIAAIDRAHDGADVKRLRPGLVTAQHDLAALCDKVRDQQAFVLIFGPLKSGKSTLMNAIAAAYVSEVSSLPAYPCLVFVRHGDKREYVCTRYNGRTDRFTAADQLHAHIESAHKELAKAIRRAEKAGEVFDPQEHFPAAIRRVDVHVPDTDLATDSTVLVDTPGLYTRMRFGYDRMTRDFRNAAACAIFVVKSDTLFLEQVFTEFEQLLALFSRIFLVVNVDSQKRDVGPDGRLVPSLEQSQPEAILAAFEQLAMSAPLKQAAAEGRVKMYPVDLLHAASSVLQQQSKKGDGAQQPQGFRAFRQDLSDYLASQQYVAAFLHDSLQRGLSLLQEVSEHAASPERREIEATIAEIDAHLEFLTAERRRLDTALELDWTETFRVSLAEIEAELERAARDHGAKLLRTLGASIDTWFLSSHSLEWLVDGQWSPLVRDYRDDVMGAGYRAFEQQQQQVDRSMNLPDGLAELADRAGVDLRAVRATALESLGKVVWQGSTSVPVDVDGIPVKKGVFDLVTFKSVDRVREQLFGGKQKPDRKIPGKEKAARLGEPGRLYLHKCVAQFRTDLTPRTVAVLRDYFGPSFQQAAVEGLRAGLLAYRPRVERRLQELEAERVRLEALCTPLVKVATSAAELHQKLDALGKQFDREEQKELGEKSVVLEPRPAQDGRGESQRNESRRAKKV
ncbi:MAG: dynamin family protein [Planctomycetes bacterium]|nr:dynamin family protein [Planctomycetota bacterium]